MPSSDQLPPLALSDLSLEQRARYDRWCAVLRNRGVEGAPPVVIAFVLFGGECVVTDQERTHALELAEKYGWFI